MLIVVHQMLNDLTRTRRMRSTAHSLAYLLSGSQSSNHEGGTIMKHRYVNRHQRMGAITRPVRFTMPAIIALVGLVFVNTSWAAFLTNGAPYFSPTGRLSPGGQQVQVVANFSCSSGETTLLRVRVSQATQASGNGWAKPTCTGSQQSTPVTVLLKPGRPAFTSGSAEVCGTHIVFRQGQVVDALAWCEDIPLVSGP